MSTATGPALRAAIIKAQREIRPTARTVHGLDIALGELAGAALKVAIARRAHRVTMRRLHTTYPNRWRKP